MKQNSPEKVKFKRIRNAIWDNFYDFCQNTVVHGFRYFVDRSLTPWERLFFLVFFLIVLMWLSVLTSKIYGKWDRTPVIVGLSPFPILINELPYPTITICNVNQARASKVRNFTRNSIEYSMLQALCARSVDKVDPSELTEITNHSRFLDFIRKKLYSTVTCNSNKWYHLSKKMKQNSPEKVKFKRIRNAIWDNFYDFCQNTVVHGFRYFVDRSLTPWERLFFLVFFLIVLMWLSVLTSKIYGKWDRTPVIVGLSPFPILINELPYPTITICNVNQARASKVRNFTRNSIEYSMLQALCARSVDKVDPSELTEITNHSRFLDFIRKSAQPCERLVVSCKFGKVTYKCTDIFKPVITDEGLCCSFNSLHTSFIFREQRRFESFIKLDGAVGVDWDPENGYQKRLPKLFYPRVGLGTGISMGLSIVINAEVEDYYCTSTNGPAFKLLLHNPIEMPSLRENGLYMKVGSETNFRISADRAVASKDIRDFNIDDRQCVFQSERYLSYFKTYIGRNCELECLANITTELCGCISYYLPGIWTNMPVCGIKHLKCEESIRYWTADVAAKTKKPSCKDSCVQACFDLSFTPNRFSIPLSSGGYMIKERALEKYNSSYLRKNIAVVHFYYKFSHFQGFMRTRYIGGTEFMSNTGGLIGLLGFSFLALAEILYFSILKPFKQLKAWFSQKISNRKKFNV